MQKISPREAERVIRKMPNLILEMMSYNSTPDQINQMLRSRCKVTADAIHQINRKLDQNTGAKSGGG